MKLRVENHDRDAASLSYVYPVLSRRAGGVSIGVNLNPNNACNYRCIYCQVPNLVFGKGPEIDLALLERELSGMLDDVVNGDFLERRVPEGVGRASDVALSGNGEPTSSPQFAAAVEVIARVLGAFDLLGKLEVILITNGTLVDRPEVARGIARLCEIGGRVWFKLDSATREGTARINDNSSSMVARVERLGMVAALCPTWLQTCMFEIDGEPPGDSEQGTYLELLSALRRDSVPLEGVLLYSLARPSMQPEAPRLSRLSQAWLEGFAARIRELGVTVRVTA